MADQLSIYNQALLHMKESTLASLTEAREARYVLDALWTDVRQQMLEAGFWKFAIRSTVITSDTDITPAFGPSEVFDKPVDWVKTYQVSASESFSPPLDNWLEEANYFFSDTTPLYLRYVSNDATEYGYATWRWTARFVEAFAFHLAWRAAPKAAGASQDLIDRLKKDKESSLASALSFEALREPVRRPPEGRWNSSRFGSGRGSSWFRFG